MEHAKPKHEGTNFNNRLKDLANAYVHKVYDYTKGFPKEEVFGLTSQLKRAALSVVLNYIEGYARKRRLVFKNFLEISYGSLKESAYLVDFSYNRGYLTKEQHKELSEYADEIGKMLWGILSKLDD
jgi:four helix bundle protein